ncbi:hypothetical protein BP6252_05164 [Coleophoma cylindrospora]|uniref:Uncharacterized protein n=1 Tax=Coleophoma cylindrospora TaxID=1849047 RepID=A0A3D8RTH0_9HELO|nr:hypothetical protein BP6252_05164 [Coleophoma cylindrospora]
MAVIIIRKPLTEAERKDPSPFRAVMARLLKELEALIRKRNRNNRPLPELSDEALSQNVQDILALIDAHYMPQKVSDGLKEEREIIETFGSFLESLRPE